MYSIASCRVMMCHFTAICFSVAPSFPCRGPGFQFLTLSLLFGQSVGHVVVEMVPLARCRIFSGRCIAERCVDTVDRVTPQSGHII